MENNGVEKKRVTKKVENKEATEITKKRTTKTVSKTASENKGTANKKVGSTRAGKSSRDVGEKAADKKVVEKKSVGKSTAEKKDVEKKSVGNKTTEKKSVENKSVKSNVAENKVRKNSPKKEIDIDGEKESKPKRSTSSKKSAEETVSKSKKESVGTQKKVSAKGTKIDEKNDEIISKEKDVKSNEDTSVGKKVKSNKKSEEEAQKESREVHKNRQKNSEPKKIINEKKEIDENFDIDKLDEEIKNRKIMSKEDKINIFKNSFYNIIFALVFDLFLGFCGYGFYHIEKVSMINNINLFSFLFLGVSLLLIEAAFKEEKMKKCVDGIETLAMGVFALFLPYILQSYTTDYINILRITGIIIAIYYVVKSILVCWISRNDILRSKDDVAKEELQDDLEADLEENDD